MKTSHDHLLHLDGIDEGGAMWRLECGHAIGADGWRTNVADFGMTPDTIDECWFMTWWDAIGAELISIDHPLRSLPIPVKPSDDWDYEDGGAIVYHREFITQPPLPHPDPAVREFHRDLGKHLEAKLLDQIRGEQ